MPELPEVETICLELASELRNKIITEVILRRPKLRWPIPQEIVSVAPGKHIISVHRRAKYLLIDLNCGSIIIHLGMSGRLHLVDFNTLVGKHDHVDIILNSKQILRFTDPRRFGCLLWQPNATVHELLQFLGPEPLSTQFDGKYLFERSRQHKVNIKSFLMDQRIVVGIGNIYAAEVLFAAHIAPGREAKSITYFECSILTKAIKEVLSSAIVCGGTTFRDFAHSNGQPGNFQKKLSVYGRGGAPCLQCQQPLETSRLGNRSVVWCGNCQK